MFVVFRVQIYENCTIYKALAPRNCSTARTVFDTRQDTCRQHRYTSPSACYEFLIKKSVNGNATSTRYGIFAIRNSETLASDVFKITILSDL